MTPNQFTFHVWTASRTLPHGERPTRKHVRVARALARYPHREPSHRQLARMAECCVRTVQNALQRLRDLGMLDWMPRFTRDRIGRWWALANHYLFKASFLLLPRFDLASVLEVEIPVLPVGKLPEAELQALRVKWGLGVKSPTGGSPSGCRR